MSWLRGRELHLGIAVGLLLMAVLLLPKFLREEDSVAGAGGPSPSHAPRPEIAAPRAPTGSLPPAGGPSQTQPARSVPAAPAHEEGAAEPPPAAPALGAIRGLVASRGGLDLADFHVEVEGVSGASAEASETGEFRIEGVPAGEYLVTALRRRDGAGGSAPVVLAPGAFETGVTIWVGTGRGVIRGQVVSAEGPVAGAQVRAVVPGFAPTFQDRTSASDGTFEIAHLDAGEYQVVASHEDGRRSEARTVLLGEGRTEFVTLRLDAGATISGRVLGDDDAPIGGVLLTAAGIEGVEAWNAQAATTEADGSFEIRGLARGDVYILTVTGDERHIGATRENVRAPATGVEITLAEGGAILLHLRGDDGTAVPGAEVSARVQDLNAFLMYGRMRPERQTPEIEPGLYRIGPLEDGTYVVRAVTEEFAAATSEPVEVVAGTEAEVTLTLGRGVTVSGSVLAPDGVPLDGVRVIIVDRRQPMGVQLIENLLSQQELMTAMGGPRNAGENPEGADLLAQQVRALGIDAQATRTGADGGFSIAHVPEGERLLVAYDPAYPAGHAAVRVPATEPGPHVEVRLEAGGTVAGRVVQVSGEPATQGMIAVQSMAGTGRMTIVGEDGRFRVTGLTAGYYMVMYIEQAGSVGNMESTSAQVRQGEETEVEIVLGQGTHVLGRVVRAGEPIAGAMVQFWSAAQMMASFEMAQTDSDGRFEMQGVRPGSYRASISAGMRTGEFEQATVTVEIADRAEVDIVIEIPVATVAGVVTDRATGVGLSGAMVLVTMSGRDVATGMGEILDRYSGTAVTAADGTFTVLGLSPGRYDVQVTAGGYVTEVETGVAAAEGMTPADAGAARIALDRGVIARGTILDTDGAPVVAAQVMVVDPETGTTIWGQFGTQAGPDGRFELPPVDPGTYNLYVYGQGYAEERVPGVRIRGDEEIAVTAHRGGSAVVMVRTPGGDPVQGAAAQFFYPDGEMAYRIYDPQALMGFGGVLTDATGRLQRIGLAAGPYTLRVSFPDTRPAVDLPIQIAEGRENTFEVTAP